MKPIFALFLTLILVSTAFAQSEPAATSPTTGSAAGFGLTFGLVFNPRIVIPVTRVTGATTEKGQLKYDLQNSLQISLEFSQFDKNSWNHGVKIDYTRFEFESVQFEGDNSGSITSAVNGALNLLTAAYVGKYRWDQFYIPLQVGVVTASNNTSDEFTKSIKVAGYLALGAGYVFTDQFAAEFSTSLYGIKSDTTTVGATTTVPENGALGYFELTAKFML